MKFKSKFKFKVAQFEEVRLKRSLNVFNIKNNERRLKRYFSYSYKYYSDDYQNNDYNFSNRKVIKIDSNKINVNKSEEKNEKDLNNYDLETYIILKSLAEKESQRKVY